MTRALTLYHGGPPGLAVGDLIRPAIALDPARRGRPSYARPHYNPHRVYVTQLRDYAEFFAMYHEGCVYEVLPIGRLLVDHDARGSFHCSAAQIVAVHQRTAVEVKPAAS